MVLGAIAGWLSKEQSALLWAYSVVGQLFLNALTLVVVPLVASSIIVGMARLGRDDLVGRLGSKTFLAYFLTSLLAVGLGMAALLLVNPDPFLESAGQVSSLEKTVPPDGTPDGGLLVKFEEILYRMVPSNILAVASQGQMLGLVLFSFVFGFLSSRIDAEPGLSIQNFFRGVFQIMMQATHLVMRALPIGVFALMAKTAAATGLEAVWSVAIFFAAVLAALGCYVFIVMPLVLFFSGISPISHFYAIFPALVTAFSTSSTAATLPITLECMEKRANIPNRICSFILPLGTTVNLSGTALYCSAAVIFIGQAVGSPLDFPNLVVVAIMGLFSAFGMVAGIPSASVVTIVMILQAVDLPVEAIAVIMPVERLLDMCRTTVNVYSNSCSASLTHRWMGADL